MNISLNQATLDSVVCSSSREEYDVKRGVPVGEALVALLHLSEVWIRSSRIKRVPWNAEYIQLNVCNRGDT